MESTTFRRSNGAFITHVIYINIYIRLSSAFVVRGILIFVGKTEVMVGFLSVNMNDKGPMSIMIKWPCINTTFMNDNLSLNKLPDVINYPCRNMI